MPEHQTCRNRCGLEDTARTKLVFVVYVIFFGLAAFAIVNTASDPPFAGYMFSLLVAIIVSYVHLSFLVFGIWQSHLEKAYPIYEWAYVLSDFVLASTSGAAVLALIESTGTVKKWTAIVSNGALIITNVLCFCKAYHLLSKSEFNISATAYEKAKLIV